MTGPGRACAPVPDEPPVDLRLVAPAAAAWVAAVLVVLHPAAAPRAAGPAAAVLALGALAVLVVGALRVVRPGRAAEHPARAVPPGPGAASPPVHAPAAAAAVLALAAAAAVVVGGGAQAVARAPAVLDRLVGAAGTVTVVGRVTEPARRLGPGDRVAFHVTASAVRDAGRWWHVRAPVAVVAPAGAPVGSTVRLHGTTGPARPATRAALEVRAREAPVVVGAPSSAGGWAAGVRASARAVAADLPPDVRGLLPAVTVGDTDAVPDDLVTAMRTSGLAHVTAVSGAHFAILGAVVLAAAVAVRAPLVLRVGCVAASGAALLLVVGPEPSVVRAAVMGGVGLLGMLAGRRAAGPAALAAAVVVLLVADPWLAVEVGFALSVAATAGLVVLGGPLARWCATWAGRTGGTLLAAPVAAQLACLPVALALWPTLGPWAVAANVVVAPAVAPATVLGLLAALVHDVWPAGAAVPAAGAGAACWWIAAVARCVTGLPGASLGWWPGAGGVVAACAVVTGAAALVLRRRGA